MEEIAKELGMCILYMLPIVIITGLFVRCIHADGVLYHIVQTYLTGLAG